MAGILLVFGIFFTIAISCSTLQPSPSAEDYYKEQKYNRALEQINTEILENPDDNSKKVLKARILKASATDKNHPSDRTPLYRSMRNTIDEINFLSESDLFTSVTDSILASAWIHEQGEGVRYLQQDGSNNFEQYFDRIVAYLDNAITIIPDSIVTYNLKATTYYRHGNFDEAISTLESIEENGFNLTPDSREKLAYLYLESGLIDSSVKEYETLATEHPQNEVYQQGLINAYILGEMHNNSVRLLETLTEEYPNRTEYQEALATEKFYLLLDESSALISDSKITESDAEQIIISLQNIASSYHEADQALPSSDERKERITEFHLTAATLLEQINSSFEPDSELYQNISTEQEVHLNDSIPNLRYLYESNSENKRYANQLLRVYNMLGMTGAAESLERNLNF